jgi:hypothetical protein
MPPLAADNPPATRTVAIVIIGNGRCSGSTQDTQRNPLSIAPVAVSMAMPVAAVIVAMVVTTISIAIAMAFAGFGGCDATSSHERRHRGRYEKFFHVLISILFGLSLGPVREMAWFQ